MRDPQRLRSCAAALAALLLVVTGCSSDGTKVTVDDASPDGPAADATVDLVAAEASPPDAGAPDLAADSLAPDTAPKPPPHWEEVQGALIPSLESHRAVSLDDGRVLIVGGGRSIVDAKWEYEPESYLYDPASDTFTKAAKLTTPREGHTATRLPDGRVLVAGGNGPDSYVKTTELFDPAAGTSGSWSAGPPMFIERTSHAAVRLASGKVLVTGGWHGPPTSSSAELFDPATNGWTGLGNAMTEVRRAHEMTLLSDGRVLISGGVDGKPPWDLIHLKTLELFDPKTLSFAAAPVQMSRARVGHSALQLADGRVLLYGGYCGKPEYCSTGDAMHEVYDLTVEAITPIAHPGAYPRTGSAALQLADGTLLAFNGSVETGKVFRFDPTLGTWTPMPDMPAPPVSSFTATLLQDGSVLVAGGRTGVTAVVNYSQKAFRFYP